MSICGTFQKLRPLNLLAHLSSCYDSTHLKVSINSVSWSIYLDQGKIIYASHSVEPFDRLDCHLRRLGHKIPTLKSDRGQLRLLFETDSENHSTQNPDYQAICWLVNQQY
jgi:twitching motility two-component system response regulator PilG